jgi:transposase-like protein
MECGRFGRRLNAINTHRMNRHRDAASWRGSQMGRPAACRPQEKARIVLEMLSGRITLPQAAAEAGVSTTAVSNWKRAFLRAASEGLASPETAGTGELDALRAENQQLIEQLRDAQVLAAIWRISVRARARRDDLH